MSRNVSRTLSVLFCAVLASADHLAAAGPVTVEISFAPATSLPFQPPEQRLVVRNHSGQSVRLPRYFRAKVQTSTESWPVAVPYPAIETDAIFPEHLLVGDVAQLIGSQRLAANETRLIVFAPSNFQDRGFLQDERLEQPGEYALRLEFFSEGSGRKDQSDDRGLSIEDFSSEQVEFVVRDAEGDDKAVLEDIREYVSRLPRARLEELWSLARRIWNERRSSSYAPYFAAFLGSPKSEEQVVILEEALRLAEGTSVAFHLTENLSATRSRRAYELVTYAKDVDAAIEQYERARAELTRLLQNEMVDSSTRDRLRAAIADIPTPEQVRQSMKDRE